MRKIFGLAALLLASIVVLYSVVPDLVRDLRYRDSYVLSPMLAVQSAKCRRYVFVVSNCTVRYADIVRPEVAGSVETMSFGSWGGERVRMVQSSRDPAQVSFTLAAEHVFGRLVFLVIWMGLLMALIAALLRSVLPLRPTEARIPDMVPRPVQPTAPAPPVMRSPYGVPPPAGAFGRRGMTR